MTQGMPSPKAGSGQHPAVRAYHDVCESVQSSTSRAFEELNARLDEALDDEIDVDLSDLNDRSSTH